MYIMGQRIFRLPLICVYMKMPHDIKKRGVLPVTDKKQLKTELLWLAAAVIGVFGAAATSVITANVILKRLPAVLSVPLSFVSEWLLLAVPVLIMIFRSESFSEFLPSNEKLDRQLFSGFVTGMILTSLLTLAPMMLGFGDSIKSVSVSKSWQYIYYLLFSFLAQAAAEELLFRGYFYSRINRLFGETAAMISSSVLFGLFRRKPCEGHFDDRCEHSILHTPQKRQGLYTSFTRFCTRYLPVHEYRVERCFHGRLKLCSDFFRVKRIPPLLRKKRCPL